MYHEIKDIQTFVKSSEVWRVTERRERNTLPLLFKKVSKICASPVRGAWSLQTI